MPEHKDNDSLAEGMADIEKRLRSLKQKVEPAESHRSTGRSHPIGRMMWLAFNVVSDLIAGVICGFGIGYGIDFWLGTRPVFIAVFLILGCAAGVLNVVRYLHRYDERQRQKQNDTSDKE